MRENGTPASEIPVFAYLVPVSDANLVPGPGGSMDRLIGEFRTDANGTFNFTGAPDSPSAPGMHNIVIEYRQSGYVPNGGDCLRWFCEHDREFILIPYGSCSH